MARVRKTKEGFGQRLARAGEAVTQGVDLVNKLKSAKQQREYMGSMQKQLDAQVDEKNIEVTAKAFGLIDSGMGKIAGTQDAKKRDFLVDSMLPIFERAYQVMGRKFDPDALKKEAGLFADTYATTNSKLKSLAAMVMKDPTSMNPLQLEQEITNAASGLPDNLMRLTIDKGQKLVEMHKKSLAEQEARKAGLEIAEVKDGKKTFARKEKEKGITAAAGKNIISALNRFNDKEGKVEREALSESQKIKSLLASGNNNAAVELSKTLFVKLAGDPRPSDADLERISPNPSVLNTLKRFRDQKLNNEALAADRAALIDLANALTEGSQKVLSDKINDYAQRGKFLNVDPEELKNVLLQDSASLLKSGGTEEAQKEKASINFKNKGQAANAMNQLLKGRSLDQLSPEELAQFKQMREQALTLK